MRNCLPLGVIVSQQVTLGVIVSQCNDEISEVDCGIDSDKRIRVDIAGKAPD